MRNIAYLAFVVIFVIIGLMVMMRKRIDPRTVASIQDSLPRVVIALILVTFSYALVGLMIDIAQVITFLVANLLSGFTISGDTGPLLESLTTPGGTNIFNLINPLVGKGFNEKFAGYIQTAFSNIAFIGDLLGAIPLKDKIIGLVLAFAALMAVFKIFFNLLTAYITLILSAIFAPFQFLLTALPGNGVALGSWFRNILANVLIFPATFLMLFLAAIMAGAGDKVGAPWDIKQGVLPTNFDWSPIPLGVFGSSSFMWQLIAFGILLATPKVGDMIKDALSIKAPPMGAAVGQDIRSAASHIPIIGGYIR